MKHKLIFIQLIVILVLAGCGGADSQKALAENNGNAPAENLGNAGSPAPEDSAENKSENELNSGNFQTRQPKTVMDYFALLPEKYFMLEGCMRDADKDCKKARAEYLKNYKEIEDIPNGYFKGGCDGGQRCIEMALFKRPDNSYVVAVATFGEMLDENHFLDYDNGKWKDISAEIVPEFSTDKRYEIPRNGTTVKVFSTKLIEKVDDYEVREKDKKIYDLVWKDGKFMKK